MEVVREVWRTEVVDDLECVRERSMVKAVFHWKPVVNRCDVIDGQNHGDIRSSILDQLQLMDELVGNTKQMVEAIIRAGCSVDHKFY